MDEGDRLEERRRRWQAHATGSFGNKQTRSLSRARAKSLNHKDSPRHHKDNNGTKPLGSIDFLASRTLLGNQGIAPTIIVRSSLSHSTKIQNGTGMASSQSHSHTNFHSHSNSAAHSNSQKSSQGTSRGQHSHSDSWSQSALRLAKSTASGALCGMQAHSSNNVMDEKAAAVEGAIMATETKVIRFYEQLEVRPEDDFMIVDSKSLFNIDNTVPDDIPGSKENLVVGPGGKYGVSPAPSGATGSGVGIALSTPPTDDHSPQISEPLSMPGHPYAQSPAYFYHHSAPIGSKSDSGSPAIPAIYAGPHPSSPKISAIASGADINDVSVRHRLPPQATLQSLPRVLHPYAMGSYPTEPKTYSQFSTNVDEPGPQGNASGTNSHVVHAYARVSTGNPETLCLGEAMTPMVEQRNEDIIIAERADQVVTQASPHGSRDSNSQTWSLRIRRKPVPHGYDEASTVGYQRSDTSTPSLDHLNPPIHQRHTSTSVLSNSSGSSLQHSPQPLGNVDDLDRFQDLFYKPEQPNLNATTTSELLEAVRLKRNNDPFPWDVGSSQSVRSGLSNLTRKLIEEFEEKRLSEDDTHLLKQNLRAGGIEGQRPADTGAEHGFIFSTPSGPRSASPTPLESPLTLHLDSSHINPEDNIPEDVRSSRESSLLESASVEDDTFGE